MPNVRCLRHWCLRYLCLSFLLCAVSVVSFKSTAATAADVWEDLAQGGLVVLMRHAATNRAPGTGNPLIRDASCSTERNLSGAGKDQAAKIGTMFAAKGITVGDVFASPYCRTMDTAQIAFGRAAPTQFLSLLEVMSAAEADATSADLSRKIGSYAGTKNLVLVTHEPNIAAVAFEPVEMGAFLVLKPMGKDEFEEVGKVYLFK